MARPEVRVKMAMTLRMKYRLGLLKIVQNPAAIKRRADAMRGRSLSEETRRRISASLKRAWKDGRLTLGPPKGVPEAEMRLREVIEPLGFIHQMKIKIPTPQGHGGLRYYTPDFTHPQLRLCIEVDGRVHWDTVRVREKDKRAESFLASARFRILRVTNEDVMGNLEVVLQRIMAAIPQPP